MKKGLKRLLFPLIAIAAISMTACGQGTQDKTKIVEKAIKANEEIKSMHADVTMSLTMTSSGESQEQQIAMIMDIIQDPLKAKVTTNIVDQELTIYLDQNYIYTGVAGTWMKTKNDANAMTQQADMSLYLNNIENFDLASEEQINGIDTYKISGVITGESLEEVMKNNATIQQMSGQSDIVSLFKDAGDLPITLWIAKNDFMTIQMDMDMTSLMNSVIQNTMASAGSSETFTVDKYTMQMTYSDINAVQDFAIPEEALNAQEINTESSAEATIATESNQ